MPIDLRRRIDHRNHKTGEKPMSALLFALSLIPVGVGPFWGAYVGRRYRGWKMTQDLGLAFAIAPPFFISMAFSVASVLTK
jgi:hypothetical protein